MRLQKFSPMTDSMRSIFILLFCTCLAQASLHDVYPRGEINRRVTTLTSLNDPQQTGTISTCSKWYDVVSGDNCATVEAAFGITNAQLLAWNPAVSSDCSTNFWTGDSYCVVVSSSILKSSSITTKSSTSTTKSISSTVDTAPNLPTLSGIPCNCDLYYDVTSGDSCSAVEEKYNINSTEFLAWNPSVNNDCTLGFDFGYSYCVGVSSAACSSTITAASSTAVGTYSIIGSEMSATLVPIPTATAWPPTLTQSGITTPCLRYYQAKAGQNCTGIVNLYSHLITMNDFLAWNPAVGSDCSGLYVNYYYCVDVPLDQSNLPNATSQILPAWTNVPPAALNSTFLPEPTAAGAPSDCQSWYLAEQKGDACGNITSTLGYLNTSEFEDWNPDVDCNNITIGDYYCVADYGTALPLPSTVSTLPSPVQSGISPSCTAWYLATSGDTCCLISQYFGTFSETDFVSWNPAVGGIACSGLAVGDYYCAAVPGTPTSPTTTATQSSLPTNGVGPQPEQPGILSICSSYWLVSTSDNCTTIATANGVSETEIEDWNPALGEDGTELLPNYYICVGMPGASTNGTGSSQTTTGSAGDSTTSSTSLTASKTSSTAAVSVATPTPVQSGMAVGCERFYLVESGNDCYDIALGAGISLTNFYAYNPGIGSSCGTLQPGCYVCVGLSGPPVTISSGTPYGPTPTSTQTGMVSSCVRFYYVESGNDCYDIALDAGISLTNLYAYNPALGSNCGGLEAEVYVCIGISGPGITITSGPPMSATAVN